jgi:hypothetical protein
MDIKQQIHKEIYTRYDEISSYLRALKHLSNQNNENYPKFIILAHYRTGSTLLASLLNCHPQVFCDNEILLKFLHSNFNKVLFPNLYIVGKFLRKKNTLYGFDLKLYQLQKLNICLADQEYQDFLLNLYQNNWKILYLKRQNLLRQEISSLIAHERKIWFYHSDGKYIEKPIFIDPQKLFDDMLKSEKIITLEKKCLSKIPHLEIIYEDDLLSSEQHQKTMDKVFKYLDLDSTKIHTNYKKTSADNLRDDIINYDEVVDFIRQTQYAHFLE